MAAPHSSTDGSALDRDKRAARSVARAAVGAIDRAAASGPIAARVAERIAGSGAVRVAFFWPLPDEPDLRELAASLDAAGLEILLPRIASDAAPLAFDRWRRSRGLLDGARGTRVANAAAGERNRGPALILVPMLAFDRARRRLGRGGGFYDRTLAALPATPTLGVAFAASELDRVPAGPLDRRLDAIATELRTHRDDDTEG